MTFIHPNLKKNSHHSSLMLNACDHKFYLYRMYSGPQKQDLKDGNEIDWEITDVLNTPDKKDPDIHLDFGDIMGKAVQVYITTGNLEKAYLIAFVLWGKNIEDDEGTRAKKTFWHLLQGIDKFVDHWNNDLSDYSLVYFNGVPAIELGFSMSYGDGFVYRGKLDLLLQHNHTKHFAVLDTKTTGSWVSDVNYKFSNQGLGYSLLVDKIADILGVLKEESYEVIYSVYSTRSEEWEKFPYTKNHIDRVSWIRDVLIDKKKIEDNTRENYWPRRGQSCKLFNRTCQFFDVCELSLEYLVGDEKMVTEIQDREGEYEFQFSLEEIIETQLKKVESL